VGEELIGGLLELPRRVAADPGALRRGPVADEAAPRGQPQAVAADPAAPVVVDIQVGEAAVGPGFLDPDADALHGERLPFDAHDRKGTERIPTRTADVNPRKCGLQRSFSPPEKIIAAGAVLPLPRQIQRQEDGCRMPSLQMPVDDFLPAIARGQQAEGLPGKAEDRPLTS
jgi:hypothetical protein